jgi:hypothetical protein
MRSNTQPEFETAPKSAWPLPCRYSTSAGRFTERTVPLITYPSSWSPDNSPNWIGQTRSRLALRRSEKPATKAGQIRALWPDIEAALTVGQTMKTICAWLAEAAGITLGVTSLTSYISRIRRRETREPQREVVADLEANVASVKSAGQELGLWPHSPATSSTKTSSPQEYANNPLAQAMKALSKPKLDIREVHGDGDPSGKNLI